MRCVGAATATGHGNFALLPLEVRRRRHYHTQRRCHLQGWSTVAGSVSPRHRTAAAATGVKSVDLTDAERSSRLAAALRVPPASSQWTALVTSWPTLAVFEPETLELTLSALEDALHCPRAAVLAVVLARPSVLLAPAEPVMALTALAQLLQVPRRAAAQLIAPRHPQLLALQPAALAARVSALAGSMHWSAHVTDACDDAALGGDGCDSPSRSSSVHHQHMSAAADAVIAIGAPALLTLLAAEPGDVHTRTAQLAAALGVPASTAAAIAQHHPRQLLWLVSPQELAARAAALSAAAGAPLVELLALLDAQQQRGLAGLLLYEPAWVAATLRRLDSGLSAVLSAGTGAQDTAQRSCLLATRLMLRLAAAPDGVQLLQDARSRLLKLCSDQSGARSLRALAAGGDVALASALTAAPDPA